jgi:hypothetical protein
VDRHLAPADARHELRRDRAPQILLSADGRSAVEVIVDAEGHADALDAGRLEVADRGRRQLHVEQTLLAGGDARAGEAGDGDLRRPAFAARAMPRRLPRAMTGMCT